MKKILLILTLAVVFSVSSCAKSSTTSKKKMTLGSTNWQGTEVFDEHGTDVTLLNTGFIGLARYDDKTNEYEFYDKITKESRGDFGVFFVTQDDKKRILVSQSKNYNAVVDMIVLDQDLFTYKRMGTLKNGTPGLVLVEHVPYSGQLKFTNSLPKYNKKTGKIDTANAGRDILSSTLWQGTVAKDAKGNDLSEYNKGFLGLARFDSSNNKYEFFDKETGVTRGDYGYYDVIRNNKVRVNVSLGRKYAAVLELTELNENKFTYARKGKDANGNDVEVFVEHIPYKGNFPINFTF